MSIFINYKGNINNFYSKNDKALSIMQSKLVWGKKAIGRHPLIISGIDVHNYDCSNVEFEDMLGHGYKQIYGKIVQSEMIVRQNRNGAI